MIPEDVVFLPEAPAHDAEIEDINEEAFGPGRHARAAFRIREGGPHQRSQSFVAVHDGQVIASVRMTPVAAGEGRAMLLGPLAVRPSHKNLGIGRHLVALAVEAARREGERAVLLVGDQPYYGPLGFQRVPYGRLAMPRPVDPARLLVCELLPGALESLAGDIVHAAMRPAAGAEGRDTAEPHRRTDAA
jgi:predicted N-acetyltransferase YhbS